MIKHLIQTGLAVLVLAVHWNHGLHAQTDVALDLETWLPFSVRAERVVRGQSASSEAFLELREQLFQWRELAQHSSQTAADEIERLTARLEALQGAQTSEADSGPNTVERLTSQLNASLMTEQASQALITDILIQTNNLIEKIDSILAERSSEWFYTASASPLNPLYWMPSIKFVWSFMTDGYQDLVDTVSSFPRRVEALNNLPTTIILGLLGLSCLFVGRSRIAQKFTRFHATLPEGLRNLLTRLESLLSDFLLPAIGVALLVRALISTGFFDFKALDLVQAIPGAVALILGVYFLSRELFGSQRISMAYTSDSWMNTAHRLARSVGWLLGISYFLNVLVSYRGITPEVRSVMLFAVILAAGLLLFKLARVTLRGCQGSVKTIWYYLTVILSVGSIGISAVSIVLASIGYSLLAQYILFSTVYTLAVCAGYWLALDIFIKGYRTLGQNFENSQLGGWVTPVMFVLGCIITVIFGILLAMSWGASGRDLSNAWQQLLEGFNVGGQVVSATTIMVFVLVILGGYVLTRVAKFLLAQSVLEYTNIEVEAKNALLKVIGYLGLTITVIVAITLAGIDLTNLALLISALSVGIGFGLQEVVANFISGIILLFERPINEGDWIEVGGTSGIVKKISVRSTTIETFDRSEVVVPNKDLMAQAVKNWTLGSRLGRIVIPVGVAYGTNVEKVMSLLHDIANNHPNVSDDPGASVAFMRFGADALEFEIRAVLTDVNHMISARSEINKLIEAKFSEEGIEIPFSQRDIWLRNDFIQVKTSV